MPGKKDKKKDFEALYIPVETLNDLARNVAPERSYVLAIKSGNSYRLMYEGERILDARIIYYFETKRIGKYLVYSADEDNGESVEVLSDVPQRNDHYKSQRTPIIEVLKDPHLDMDTKQLKEIENMEAKDMSGLIRAVINDMGEDESPKVYSFPTGKGRIVGTLTLLKEHNRIFLFARVGSKTPFTNITYDYNTDMVETSTTFGGIAKIHIRVINLAKAPAFFRD